MYYVISYDIPDNLRRSHLNRLLLNYGERKQESLFEARINESQYKSLLVKIHKIIKESEDNVRIYPLCLSCLKNTVALGGTVPEKKDPDFYLV